MQAGTRAFLLVASVGPKASEEPPSVACFFWVIFKVHHWEKIARMLASWVPRPRSVPDALTDWRHGPSTELLSRRFRDNLRGVLRDSALVSCSPRQLRRSIHLRQILDRTLFTTTRLARVSDWTRILPFPAQYSDQVPLSAPNPVQSPRSQPNQIASKALAAKTT